MTEDSKLYSSLTYLNCDSYQPGKTYTLLQINTDPIRETTRLSVKLKLVTDTYILQEKRSRFHGLNQNSVCCLCNEQDETIEHFILQCKVLEPIRQSVISEINSICLEQNGNLSMIFLSGLKYSLFWTQVKFMKNDTLI